MPQLVKEVVGATFNKDEFLALAKDLAKLGNNISVTCKEIVEAAGVETPDETYTSLKASLEAKETIVEESKEEITY